MGRLIEIAQPCGSSWGEMSGAGARRHCGLCNKTVHSLSDMDPVAADELLARSRAAPESICVRVRCDSDGYVRFAGGTAQLPGPTKLRLRLTPLVLSAGLMAACHAPNDDGRPPAATAHSSDSVALAAQPFSAQRSAVAVTAAGATRFDQDVARAMQRAREELSKPAAKMNTAAPAKRTTVPSSDREFELLGDVK